jgi:hypothetical protein
MGPVTEAIRSPFSLAKMLEARPVDALERRVAALEAENRRLRNMLNFTNGIGQPPPEQRALDLRTVGRTDRHSGAEAQLALYMHLFAARTDVYAYRWENVTIQVVNCGGLLALWGDDSRLGCMW